MDRLLTEGAGSIIPPLVALVGGGQIMQQVESFFTNMLKSLVSVCVCVCVCE